MMMVMVTMTMIMITSMAMMIELLRTMVVLGTLAFIRMMMLVTTKMMLTKPDAKNYLLSTGARVWHHEHGGHRILVTEFPSGWH